ncbi:hypothetical protein PaecuDRAFT_3599 [Paenibacillus curdlanolyticus YK9]|uniref:Uncharacterized protein n=1 Tax=Paenibacillus curdlanolyticus YK9 TaxID=717606 RepID=E0ID97_9BACL|nr:hypothetical protein PaecuDRAFT_3599 [Paenibacillus curdlanolyticus YK9]
MAHTLIQAAQRLSRTATCPGRFSDQKRIAKRAVNTKKIVPSKKERYKPLVQPPQSGARTKGLDSVKGVAAPRSRRHGDIPSVARERQTPKRVRQDESVPSTQSRRSAKRPSHAKSFNGCPEGSALWSPLHVFRRKIVLRKHEGGLGD